MNFVRSFIVAFALPMLRAQQPDNGQDAALGYSIEKLSTTVRFAADGTSERERVLVFRLESDAAVRALGVLTFPFSSENEKIAVDYVRVRKRDGAVIETPESNFQETASPVTSMAPMYSDLRVKQIPVRALASGDRLEYRMRWIETKPMIANQFWYEHNFSKETEVTEETLTVRVPAGKYIKVSNPGGEPQVREENGEKIYFWKTSHAAEPPRDKDRPSIRKGEETSDRNKADGGQSDQTQSDETKHSVELTTFRNWEEVGRWYQQISADQSAVTPAIQAKADELTKGLTSAEEKERALYNYVSTKFRYISVSFGEGRYQPHAAAEVLSNLYGDCKDKHTLLAALLKAAGIEASAVLIGSDLPFNKDIPSPAQFNHVITMIAGGGGRDVWLDATPEVAPFGLIEKPLRDRQALLVPPGGTPRVVSTPAAAAVPNSEAAHFKGELDAEGTLTGHLDLTVRGDLELILRAIFHETPPAQWNELAQRLSAGMGYGGVVSGVDIANPQDTTGAFHYGWDYRREKYADWANLRITAPLPSMGFPEPGDDPKAKTELGDTGEYLYDATVRLPAGYSVDIPGPVHQTTSFAEFEGSYSVTGSVLETRRSARVFKATLPAGGLTEYRNFSTAVNSHLGQFIVLTKGGAGDKVVVSESDPRAEELIGKAVEAVQRRDFNGAQDALSQAELLNSKQRNLWWAWAILYSGTEQRAKAVESMHKEIELHPGEPAMYRDLARMERFYGHGSEAAAALRQFLKISPDDADASKELAGILIGQKEFDEAVGTLDQARKTSPDDLKLETLRIQALLQGGRKQDGIAAARAIGPRSPDADELNSVAYELAETGADLKLAREYADRSVKMVEEGLRDVKLSGLKQEQLHDVYTLAMVWDTAGWASFLAGDLAKAEKSIEASWKLSEHGVVADHLAQIYEKQGRKEQAVHLWRLALATGDKAEGVSERLQKMDGPKVVEKNGNVTTLTVGNTGVEPAEELGKLRTVEIADFSRPKGTAEYFVLLSAKGVEDVMFLSGADELRGAKEAIMKAKFDTPFADNGPEKMARRGILSCSALTRPNCQLVLMLPSNTTAP